MIHTVCVQVDEPAEREAFAARLLENKNTLRAISANEGCGCCVDMFQLLVEKGTPVPVAIGVSQVSGEGLESFLEKVSAQAIQALADTYL